MSDTSVDDTEDDSPESDFLGDFFASVKELVNSLLVSKPAPDEVANAKTKLADACDAANMPALSALAPSFVDAAAKWRPDDLGLYDFASILASICWRETRAGAVARPAGSAGTGDPSSRWLANPPAYATELGLLTGNSKVSTSGNTLYEVQPPAYANAQVRGWGYGLMQIDFASYRSWLDENDWTSPDVNIDKGANIFMDSYEQCETLLAAVCGYNAGPVRANRVANPDSVTTGKNYGSSVLSTALSLGMDPSLWQPNGNS